MYVKETLNFGSGGAPETLIEEGKVYRIPKDMSNSRTYKTKKTRQKKEHNCQQI